MRHDDSSGSIVSVDGGGPKTKRSIRAQGSSIMSLSPPTLVRNMCNQLPIFRSLFHDLPVLFVLIRLPSTSFNPLGEVLPIESGSRYRTLIRGFPGLTLLGHGKPGCCRSLVIYASSIIHSNHVIGVTLGRNFGNYYMILETASLGLRVLQLDRAVQRSG